MSESTVPMVLITGWSGAGKTTAGNYLELPGKVWRSAGSDVLHLEVGDASLLDWSSLPRLVHGWKHLDGDNIMHRKDAESLKLTEGLALWHTETSLGLAIPSMSKVHEGAF